MIVPELLESGSRTLADRLAEGRMQPPEALRYAIQVAEALRDLHSTGRVHGNVCPASVVLVGSGIGLTPPAEDRQDQAAGVSRDISAFGELLYEALTGRRATGEDGCARESTGLPAADRLIASCFAEEPQCRLLSMQKVLLELRLISVAARNAGPSAAGRREAAEAALRAEMQAVEHGWLRAWKSTQRRMRIGLRDPLKRCMRRDRSLLPCERNWRLPGNASKKPLAA